MHCPPALSPPHTPSRPPRPQVDPLDDIDVINLELALADLEVISKRQERLRKGERGGGGGRFVDTSPN